MCVCVCVGVGVGVGVGVFVFVFVCVCVCVCLRLRFCFCLCVCVGVFFEGTVLRYVQRTGNRQETRQFGFPPFDTYRKGTFVESPVPDVLFDEPYHGELQEKIW